MAPMNMIVSKVMRLSRSMCGKALPFRGVFKVSGGYASDSEAEPRMKKQKSLSERRSLSAHQAAKPLLGQRIQDLTDLLHRQILVVIEINLKHRGSPTRTETFN